jgi:hypothetical protein
MITQGPFGLTLGQTLPLNDPGATSNNPATAVQIQNASPFIIEVNSGGNVLTIQSFTAQTMLTSGGGQQMSVDAIASGPTGQTTSPRSLTVVWLLGGESAPMVDGPLTASAIATTLAQSGIGGAKLISATVALPANTGPTPLAAVPDGTYRLWNFGFNLALATDSPPTKGLVFVAFDAAGSTADDTVGWQGDASNRLAGMVFVLGGPMSGAVEFINYTDAAIEAFITYSDA